MNDIENHFKVSIITVIKNEIRYIERCLDALMNQDYPKNLYEVIIIDGRSTDGTREFVLDKTKESDNIVFLDNPKETYAAGLNLGIKKAGGEIIIKVDGHVVVEKNFISKNVEYLNKINATAVGGRIITVNDTFLGNMIAKVLSSPFGVGNAKFRYSSKPGYVKTLAFGAYQKEIFNQVGLFDETRNRTEDLDLHSRIRQSGGKLYYAPDIKSFYYSRSTIKGFVKQAYQNGSEVMTALNAVCVRHLIPFFFVCGILFSIIVYLFFSPILILSLFLCYFLTATIVSVMIAFKRKWRYLPFLPILFFLLHATYGIGSFLSLIKSGIKKLISYFKITDTCDKAYSVDFVSHKCE